MTFRELLSRDLKCTRAPGPILVYEDDGQDERVAAFYRFEGADDLLRLSARAAGLWARVQRLAILNDESMRRLLGDFLRFYDDLAFDLAVAEAAWAAAKAKTDGVHRALREANELQARLLGLGGRYEMSTPRWLPEVRNQGANTVSADGRVACFGRGDRASNAICASLGLAKAPGVYSACRGGGGLRLRVEHCLTITLLYNSLILCSLHNDQPRRQWRLCGRSCCRPRGALCWL